MTVSIEIKGLKELQKALEQLPKEIQARPLRSAVSAGAKVIMDEAIARAPEGDTGNLKDSIYRYRSRKQSATGKETFLVGVRKGKGTYGDTRRNRRLGIVGKKYITQGKAFYWRFIEFGTRFIQAKPFMRPAYESKKLEAAETIKERLKKAIDTQARKLKK